MSFKYGSLLKVTTQEYKEKCFIKFNTTNWNHQREKFIILIEIGNKKSIFWDACNLKQRLELGYYVKNFIRIIF